MNFFQQDFFICLLFNPILSFFGSLYLLLESISKQLLPESHSSFKIINPSFTIIFRKAQFIHLSIHQYKTIDTFLVDCFSKIFKIN